MCPPCVRCPQYNSLVLSACAATCLPPLPSVRSPCQVEGDLLLGDMGQGLPMRTGCFDGAISISALQWLCNADRAGHEPRARLRAFFTSLYRALTRGSRAVLQVRVGVLCCLLVRFLASHGVSCKQKEQGRAGGESAG